VTGWLLDTNIVSEIRRPRPEAKVVSAIEAQPLEQLYISVVTLAEIRFGIEQLEDFKRRTELNIWLSNKVRPMFDQRVLPITEDIMVKWRLLVEDGRKAGYTYSQPDLIIGATAIHYGLTVMSRDTIEYIRAGVPVFNPWTDRLPTPNNPV
jgi:toxin FitB